LFSRFRDLRSPDAFGAYLRRTLVNLTRDHHRRGLLRGKHQRAVAPEALDVELPDLGLRQDLWNALMRLPHRQRAAVVLRYYQDLTESQVAEVLGCSPGAAKSLLARGMNSLRTIVKEMELN
jgi:RNA polymerase sigma factor (sigma-70 family)